MKYNWKHVDNFAYIDTAQFPDVSHATHMTVHTELPCGCGYGILYCHTLYGATKLKMKTI